MLFEFEVTVIESDPNIKCFNCGKGFGKGSVILTRGHALIKDDTYSRKHRIYSGGEGNRMYYHIACREKKEVDNGDK